MDIHQADFVGSYPKPGLCPTDRRAEFAFIGRSNVGKSSLINMLCGRKSLAHVSNKPGKTQLLNYYLINEEWYLVDLPGYGYAKRSKKERRGFGKMINGYFLERSEMYCAFVLVDSNIPPQDIDVEFINWLGEHGIPFVLVYTKTDRLNQRTLDENLDKIRNKLLEYWTHLPQEFITSSRTGEGRDEVLTFIENTKQAI
ncbi:ribosome biogenesis GTP-binding protein YihA/YsxC [Flavilitoribacter nigricans]|uniref:Probable GTP-binding protein EngB n=1 Tax=Flavilitoribacter nigricans (strain ATCC 23147 / DSM 23189 / NBRC 102662 / NCIMB 1420 / SS-2) TaxID=1122177 RepID=A0A2D0N361_FLAN2|nr:ribosome biogenesis GTP-binding protein YihA/YsxC [Flavilitoribacter nigricans]PHN02951.1 YihA family ribosome biogenesis GTP-binding protein [Flavilitoribacter nigricans DSM 23189 = NBRC 102662]